MKKFHDPQCVGTLVFPLDFTFHTQSEVIIDFSLKKAVPADVGCSRTWVNQFKFSNMHAAAIRLL
ncbi:hypothetical protein SDC9_40641 [bioreactor metagenome]|uniref:Uncharacterized protein n=1 Tax=bioreactor metagenome TaxID=1076179 RepID=A0A644VT75_9ZZZZ